MDESRFVARYSRGSEQVYRVYPRAAEFSLHEAAETLARVFPSLPRRFGRKTVYTGLQKGASREFEQMEANPEMVALYRDKLLELGVFKAPKKGKRS